LIKLNRRKRIFTTKEHKGEKGLVAADRCSPMHPGLVAADRCSPMHPGLVAADRCSPMHPGKKDAETNFI
jgi:hypothetical protein